MTAIVTAVCLLAYVLAYRIYAKYLADRVFALDPEAETPAHSRELAAGLRRTFQPTRKRRTRA